MTTVFLPPSLTRFAPLRRPDPELWLHLGLAYDLVAAQRPRTAVAIGVNEGAIFFALCQSIREHDLEAIAYAVGEWTGPEEDTDAPYDAFLDHRRAYYWDFAYALRMSSDTARAQFRSGSVDLLALEEEVPPGEVASIAEAWLPSLRPGGIAFVHHVGEDGSPARTAWDELARQYPSLTLEGGRTAGVLRKPGPVDRGDGRMLEALFESGSKDRETVRAIYRRVAEHLALEDSIGAGQFGRMRNQDRGS